MRDNMSNPMQVAQNHAASGSVAMQLLNEKAGKQYQKLDPLKRKGVGEIQSSGILGVGKDFGRVVLALWGGIILRGYFLQRRGHNCQSQLHKTW